jgi:hypothetical protein
MSLDDLQHKEMQKNLTYPHICNKVADSTFDRWCSVWIH